MHAICLKCLNISSSSKLEIYYPEFLFLSVWTSDKISRTSGWTTVNTVHPNFLLDDRLRVWEMGTVHTSLLRLLLNILLICFISP